MPSSSSRNRSPARRSPRASRPTGAPARTARRPQLAPFAAVFGLLVAGEHGYLAFLLSVTWWAVLPALLGVLAVAGSVLVWLGRGRGWLAVTVSAALLVLGLVLVAIVFGVFGGGAALAEALLLLLGPVGALALATRPPVRAWTTRRARRA